MMFHQTATLQNKTKILQKYQFSIYIIYEQNIAEKKFERFKTLSLRG